ncbi:MAG TPA: coiled coil domain-containing protein [bacterium]|nr:coiled coil domain-containing protein [bacterium]
MEDRKSYIDKLSAQLKEWDAKLDEMESKAKWAKSELKENLAEEIEALRSKKEKANNDLKKLQQGGEGAWEELKQGVEKSWDEMKNAFENAFSKFK